MHLVNDFANFEHAVKARGQEVYERTGKTKQITALILAPARDPIAEEIGKSLSYWDARSADYVDFYWPGFELGYRRPVLSPRA